MNNYKFDTNNYDFNTSSDKAVYLLHGFSSTTYEIRQLAEFLGNNGYHAVAKNLPGHGTNIDECNRVKFHDWLDFVKKDIALLSSKSRKIFIYFVSVVLLQSYKQQLELIQKYFLLQAYNLYHSYELK